IDTHVPDDLEQRKQLIGLIKEHHLCLVIQQHQAYGETFESFKKSFFHYLEICASANPILINSHTGKDYFSFEQNMELIDMAQSFSVKCGIEILHETHRGRFGFSPLVIKKYFDVRPELQITADFSHWVCVSESFLEGFYETLHEAILRTKHIHARIGYEEGPQVSDPRAPEWKYAMDHFFKWWDEIITARQKEGADLLTITTEFGPPPYFHTVPFTNKPLADLFEVNCYMKELLRNRYAQFL
ncbi:MAG: sugar phosphate isomerase/epimerase, partial [Chitinophagaceae bacterium]